MSRSYGVGSDRWSNFDKFSTSLSSPNRYRSKSPYRSTSSLSRTSSTSNLKIDDDYFNALNKSLGAHDASFIEEDSGSMKSGHSGGGGGGRYTHSLTRPSSSSRNRYQSGGDSNRKYKSTFDDDGDLGHKYRYGTGKSYGSYDNDLNNNYPSTFGGVGGGYSTTTTTVTNKGVSYAAASDSEPEYEPYSYKYDLKSKSTKQPKTTLSSSTKNRGEHRLFDYGNHNNDNSEDDDDDGGHESDESMNEYLNCKSFYPDNLSEAKLFVS